MARCKGITTRGTRCRNEALEGLEYCYVHRDQDREEARARRNGAKAEKGAPDMDFNELARTALGFALVGAVVLWAVMRRR